MVLFDKECFIYFNASDDKGTQLKLSEQPDFEQETDFLTKKEQPEHKGSDCYHLAEAEGFEPQDALTSTVFKTAAFDRSAKPPRLLNYG